MQAVLSSYDAPKVVLIHKGLLGRSEPIKPPGVLKNDYYIHPDGFAIIVLNKKAIAGASMALVDVSDIDFVSEWAWCTRDATKRPYVRGYKANKREYLHRLLTNVDKFHVVDHINGEPLDNRRCNLVVRDQSENCHNTLTPNGMFRNVHRMRNSSLWEIRITIRGERIRVRNIKTDIEAALEVQKIREDYIGCSISSREFECPECGYLLESVCGVRSCRKCGVRGCTHCITFFGECEACGSENN